MRAKAVLGDKYLQKWTCSLVKINGFSVLVFVRASSLEYEGAATSAKKAPST